MVESKEESKIESQEAQTVTDKISSGAMKPFVIPKPTNGKEDNTHVLQAMKDGFDDFQG